MKITISELATHKVFAQFRTGDTVTIIVYDRTASLTPALTSAACAEIGATGIFEWNFSQLVAQPTISKQYVWIMSDVPGTTQTGTVFAVVFVESEDPVRYSGLRFAMSKFQTGDTVTITVYNPNTGAAVGLQSDVCTEIGSTGYFYWSTEYLTHGEQDTYLWVMDNTTTTSAGEFNFGDYEDDPSSGSQDPLYRFRSS